jgi:hypothetical protein
LDNFANSTNDSWRPAELLGDAVYIQSGTFKDGFVSTTFVRDELGVSASVNGGKVSFENSNILGKNSTYDRPLSTVSTTNPTYQDVIWREDGRDGNSATGGQPGGPDTLPSTADAAKKRAPVYFDRNGVAWYRRNNANLMIPVADQTLPDAQNSDYNYFGIKGGDWDEVRQDNLQLASETTVNALIVSGVTPVRVMQVGPQTREQTYGGLNNFPRFNESWEIPGNTTLGTSASNVNLFIAGAFYQLFLSHTATAPYYTSSWEVQDSISNGAWYFYYQPPNRIWGYDVPFNIRRPTRSRPDLSPWQCPQRILSGAAR